MQPTSHPIPAYFLYGEPLEDQDERRIHIETVAARSALHDWHIRPHRHRDLHQFLVITRGRSEVSLDENDIRLDAPGVIIVPCGSVHSFRWKHGTIGLVISVTPGLAAELSAAVGGLQELLEHPRVVRFDRRSLAATDLQPLAAMLLREFTRAAVGRQPALRGLLAALLANVLRLMREVQPHALHQNPGFTASDRELVARFRQLCEAHYREHRSIRFYVRQLGVSDSRLRRACIAVSGRPPVELVHARLLIESERLLRYTTMSVGQVAYHLGFTDPPYFTRFFKRLRGAPPSAFRDGPAYDLTD